MTLLRDDRDDFAALIGRAAATLRIDPAFVEKDYWVTELLRSLARPLDAEEGRSLPPLVIFKGGTSLVKAYGLIERFSEDVDILVAPPSGMGLGPTDRLLKRLVARASEDLGVAADLVNSTRGVKRTVAFGYPPVHKASVLRPGLLLEMGTRGGSQPSHRLMVGSYVAQAAGDIDPDLEASDLAPVSLWVLGPERTLVEKLQLVHTAAVMAAEDPDRLLRAGRHFYDIWRLLTAPSVMDALAGHPGGIADLAEDIHRHSEAAGFPSVPRPAEGYAASPAFADPRLLPAIGDAYRTVGALVWGEVPSLAAILASVSGAASLL